MSGKWDGKRTNLSASSDLLCFRILKWIKFRLSRFAIEVIENFLVYFRVISCCLCNYYFTLLGESEFSALFLNFEWAGSLELGKVELGKGDMNNKFYFLNNSITIYDYKIIGWHEKMKMVAIIISQLLFPILIIFALLFVYKKLKHN